MRKEMILNQAIELHAVIEAARIQAETEKNETCIMLSVISKMADELVGSIRKMEE